MHQVTATESGARRGTGMIYCFHGSKSARYEGLEGVMEVEGSNHLHLLGDRLIHIDISNLQRISHATIVRIDSLEDDALWY